MAITLYDLAGAEAERRFSPFCWRTRMALAHKGLEVETVPWRFTEKDKLPQPNGGRVPVIVDGGQVVHDSSAIADHLEMITELAITLCPLVVFRCQRVEVELEPIAIMVLHCRPHHLAHHLVSQITR